MFLNFSCSIFGNHLSLNFIIILKLKIILPGDDNKYRFFNLRDFYQTRCFVYGFAFSLTKSFFVSFASLFTVLYIINFLDMVPVMVVDEEF